MGGGSQIKALDMGQEDIDMIKTTHSDNDEKHAVRC